MGDGTLSFTALPSLHVALVHFPLAVAPVAALFDLVGLTMARKSQWVRPAASALWVLAAGSAVAARWSGEQAADALGRLDLHADLALAKHDDQAWVSMLAMVVVAGLRLLLSRREDDQGAPSLVLGSLHLSLAVAVLGQLAYTADLGGRLVYHHGLGVGERVAIAPPGESTGPAPLGADAAAADTLLMPTLAGTVLWRPSGPSSAGGVTVESVSGPNALRTVQDPGDGLVLAIAGQGRILLPNRYSDVQLAATVDLGGFVGTVGLIHHRTEREDRVDFERQSAGGFEVRLVRDGVVLAATPAAEETPAVEEATTVHLAVSAVGPHLEGLLESEVVVHAHEPQLAAGAVGLWFDGRGTVRILEVEVVPAVPN